MSIIINFQNISITHFVSPSLFWFQVGPEPSADLVRLESLLDRHFHNLPYQREHKPKLKEVVAVYSIALRKYFRAEVKLALEYNDRPNKYLLWAFDVGKLIETWHGVIVRKLPEDLAKIQVENVYCGGLDNVVPAISYFDINDRSYVTEMKAKWSERSCRLFQETTRNVNSLEFAGEKRITSQFFGQLTATVRPDVKVNLGKFLATKLEATKADDLVHMENVLNQQREGLTLDEIYSRNYRNYNQVDENKAETSLNRYFHPWTDIFAEFREEIEEKCKSKMIDENPRSDSTSNAEEEIDEILQPRSALPHGCDLSVPPPNVIVPIFQYPAVTITDFWRPEELKEPNFIDAPNSESISLPVFNITPTKNFKSEFDSSTPFDYNQPSTSGSSINQRVTPVKPNSQFRTPQTPTPPKNTKYKWFKDQQTNEGTSNTPEQREYHFNRVFKPSKWLQEYEK